MRRVLPRFEVAEVLMLAAALVLVAALAYAI
jgi:hypothetical protein